MADFATLFHCFGPAVDTPGHLAALAVAAIAGRGTTDVDVAPFLAVICPPAAPLTAGGRRYLAALAGNDDLWLERYPAVDELLRRAGLPDRREECRALGA